MDGELETNKRIAKNIRMLRDLRGLRQGFVAAQLGITPNGYGKIERGESSLTVDRLEAIARILGMNVPELIVFDPDQDSNQLEQVRVPYSALETAKQELDILKDQVKELQNKILQHSKMLELLMEKEN